MSGCATLSGIAVLENVRTDIGQTLLFDAHFYFYDDPSSTNALLALLRYYNIDNYTFDPEVPFKCFVQVNVARMEAFCNENYLSIGMELKDYVLVGDIVQLIPAESSDPKFRPFLTVCGIVTSYNRDAEEKKIEVAPVVFTHVLGSKQNQNASLANSASAQHQLPSPSFPVSYIIPQTSRWKAERVPKVSIGTYVCLEGFLHMVHRDSSGMVERFDAELDKITYLGRPYVPASSRKLPVPVNTPSTPANKKLKFSYSDSVPSPSPATGKRKLSNLDNTGYSSTTSLGSSP
ncbi:hypothetical protein C8R42DRAFT_681697 [Lentinula raphanica]|nr:hypothetical protein C8R42DRAFT_681697 [Lentinula raphanica]